MSGRVVSADTNSNRRRQFASPRFRSDANVVNGLKNSSSYKPTSEKSLEMDDVYAEEIKVKVYVNQKILCHSIQTLIKNVFQNLSNFAMNYK